MPEVIVEVRGRVGVVRLSNPGKYNAMSLAMWRRLPLVIEDFDANDAIRVIVVEGDGEKAFVSGSDITQFESERGNVDAARIYNEAVDRGLKAPMRCAKPVLAKVRGHCIGGGMGIAAFCDVRIASTDAKFRIPAARTAIGFPASSVQRLMQLVGPQATADILFSARAIDAREALAIGFLSRHVEPADLDSVCADWCEHVADNAPLTLRAIKRSIRESLEAGSIAPSEELADMIDACFASEDYAEGTRAFMERRPAVFRGR